MHTTRYNIFENIDNIPLIMSGDGLLIHAPKVHKTNIGQKTVASLPANITPKKHEIFFKKVISVHHPIFNNTAAINDVVKYGYERFNIEKLLEETCAYVGGYNFIGGIGQDFDDVECSDLKTVSVNVNTGIAELSSISAKVGTLRIMIYNPVVQDIHYFYMPFSDWTDMATKTYNEGSGSLRLRFQYSIRGNYNQFERFRVNDFTTLATKMTLAPGWNTPII